MTPLVLVAAAPADSTTDVVFGFLILGIVAAVVVTLFVYHARASHTAHKQQALNMKAAQQRAELEKAAHAEQAEINNLVAEKVRTEVELLKLQVLSVKRDLENPAAKEHQELTVQRTRRELELLELQIQLATRDLETRPDTRDYHEVSLSKARLEIDSLRLQIQEQRKRLDDFGQYGE